MVRSLDMVAGNQVAHPGRLACDVHIVGSLLYAGRHQRAAQQGKRSGRTQEHRGARRQYLQRCSVICIGQHDVRQLPGALRPHGFELLQIAPGDGPGAFSHVGMLRQVLRGLASDKSAGTE